jgi:hypothetical protein
MSSDSSYSYIESPSLYIFVVIDIFSCLSYLYSQFINMNQIDNKYRYD